MRSSSAGDGGVAADADEAVLPITDDDLASFATGDQTGVLLAKGVGGL